MSRAAITATATAVVLCACTNGTPTCDVGAVPADVRASFGLSPFYEQYVSVDGLPVIGSSKVKPEALCVARDVVSNMLATRPAILTNLVDHKIRLAIMAQSEVTTDIPEHADLTPKDYWDQRARGLGASLARPAASAAEENILCLANDPYRGESILVHEFSHTVFNIGVELERPDARTTLDALFAAARSAGLYDNTYAATNADEYWAEGAQDWFDTNLTAQPADGIHNEIHTRAQLEIYDPNLASLLAGIYDDTAWRYACP